jgi:hypothetical protein
MIAEHGALVASCIAQHPELSGTYCEFTTHEAGVSESTSLVELEFAHANRSLKLSGCIFYSYIYPLDTSIIEFIDNASAYSHGAPDAQHFQNMYMYPFQRFSKLAAPYV